MKKILLLFVVFFSSLLSQASDGAFLLLTNPRSQESHVFREGSYIVFELKQDGSVHEGFIRDISDSSITLDYSQVSLSQIHILAGSTKGKLVAGRVANALGNTLLFAGTTVFDCGSNIMLYNDYYYWPIGGTVWLAGACIAGLGYMFDWALNSPESSVRVRNYRDWEPSIMREGQQRVPEKQIAPQNDSTQTVPEKPKKGNKKKGNLSEDDVYGK